MANNPLRCAGSFRSEALGSFQMAAASALACEIIIDQLPEAGRAEAGEVAAMHGADGQFHKLLKRSDVIADIGVIGIIDQRAIVDDVA